MYKKISLLLIATLIIGCSGMFSVFEITTYPDYETPGYYNDRISVPIIYDQHRINRIKSDDEKYIQIASVSGKNSHGAPEYDETFRLYIIDVCNKLDGDMALYEMDKSVPKNYLHTYTIVKKR